MGTAKATEIEIKALFVKANELLATANWLYARTNEAARQGIDTYQIGAMANAELSTVLASLGRYADSLTTDQYFHLQTLYRALYQLGY